MFSSIDDERVCKEGKFCKVWRNERLCLSNIRYNVFNVFFNWWFKLIEKRNFARRNERLYFVFDIMFSSIDDVNLQRREILQEETNSYNVFFNWWCQLTKKRNFARRNELICFLQLMVREFIKKGNFARCEETNDCTYLIVSRYLDIICTMFSWIDLFELYLFYIRYNIFFN